MFEYLQLGRFTYNILKDKNVIKPFLMKWLGREWERDHVEFPDQKWTLEWLEGLKLMKFQLEIVRIGNIIPRAELMSYEKDGYSFTKELNERADEREESMMKGVSLEPLIIKKEGFELMDGYTRYLALKRLNEKQVYAYVGYN